MSYTIIFETKIINLPDGRILHLSLSGCNNDDEGRDRHEFSGKIYTMEEWKKYVSGFSEAGCDDYDGFDLKIGSRYCNWSDYGKHLLTMEKRAMPWEVLTQLHGAYASTYDGITVHMKDGSENIFPAGKLADNAFDQMFNGTLPYKYYRRNSRKLDTIEEIIKELEMGTVMEFYVGRRKKELKGA